MAGDFRLRNIHLAWEAIKKIKNWPVYFLDLFGLTNKKYVTYRMRNGLNYVVRANTTDRGILTSVDLADEYEINDLVLPENAVIVDIGAHVGIFSVYSSRKAKKTFLYEPVPENYRLILRNIALNKLGNKLIPFNLAVSGKGGKLRIFLSHDHTASHSVYRRGKDHVNVRATTLKEIFDKNKIKRCDLLKMDAEGSEYEILYNLPSRYFKKIIRIRMECHDIDNNINNHRQLIKYLNSKGFKIVYKNDNIYAQQS